MKGKTKKYCIIDTVAKSNRKSLEEEKFKLSPQIISLKYIVSELWCYYRVKVMVFNTTFNNI
jgi:hypothetical protein